MRRLQLVITLMFLCFFLVVGCATKSPVQQSSVIQKSSTDHKCVWTNSVTHHTITVCLPECPDHPDWRDDGPPCP